VAGDSPVPLAAVAGGGALAVAAPGTTSLNDSLTYVPVSGAIPVATAVAVVSKNGKRPVVRLAAGREWVFVGKPGSALALEGLLVSGGDIVLRGDFDQVTLRSMTLDPGGAASAGATPPVFDLAADGRDLVPTRLWIEGKVGTLLLDRCIGGPIRTRNGGILGQLHVSDSIVHAIRTAGFGNFKAADIKDAWALAARLRRAHSPLARHLQSVFPAALNAELAAYRDTAPPSAALLHGLVEGLNIALHGPSMYTIEKFQGIPLSRAALDLVAHHPAGDALVELNRRLLEDAYPVELADSAIATADGETSLTRTTVLGRLHVHRLMASECILDDLAVAEDSQRGCVRFSAWVTRSVLPKRYECVEIPRAAPIFTSRIFGNPGYAQLSLDSAAAIVAPAGGSILEGAQNGSEMGAFYAEKNAIKERSLSIKLEEYMPLWLAPVPVYVT
jgi:hypothetical protein